MAPADYGATLAFIVFVHQLALIPVLIAISLKSAPPDAEESDGSAAADDPAEPSGANDQELDDDTRFLYDIVARDNEVVIQNIDALDNSLIAVAVGVIVVALFAADKWLVLEATLRFVATVLLGECAVVAVLGYLSAYLVKAGSLEIVRVPELVIDFADFPADVTGRAISMLAGLTTANRRVRSMKRIFTISATFFIFAAVIVLVAGRALGGVAAR